MFFFIFFSYNLPTGIPSAVKKILFFAKILCINFYFAGIQSAQHIYEKREGAGAGSGSGSGSPTLGKRHTNLKNSPFKSHCKV